MKEKYYEEARRRFIHYENYAYRTIQFENYEEMFSNIVEGDNVLVYHNLGRYEMIVKSKDIDKIYVQDYVTGFYIRKNDSWYNNEIEKVEYIYHDEC